MTTELDAQLEQMRAQLVAMKASTVKTALLAAGGLAVGAVIYFGLRSRQRSMVYRDVVLRLLDEGRLTYEDFLTETSGDGKAADAKRYAFAEEVAQLYVDGKISAEIAQSLGGGETAG